MADRAGPLSGRRALVTGANSDIGYAIAQGLADLGAELILHRRSDAKASGDERALFETCPVLLADFLDQNGAAKLAEAALALGPVDILIANAAMEQRQPWQDLDPAFIDRHVSANFTSMLMLMAALVPPMEQRKWGRVIAIGSIMATRPRAETVVYASLKSAQLTAVRSIARDVASNGVTVNVVSPGAIETGHSAALYAQSDFRQAVTTKIPMGRPGTPEDCVAPVTMLCCDGASYITGVDIPVNGGWDIGDAPGNLTEFGK
jgi:2-deoxy-D-gluconate 3-dehydrogenase